jgi:hypothetical protein
MSAPVSATCPRCGAFAPMLPIVFGYPTPDTFLAAERGDLALGGCVVSGEDPTHQCSACGNDVILDDELEAGRSFAAIEEVELWEESIE